MDIFNSVDMSWAFQIFSGAYRDLCRNTLVFGGQKAYHQRKIHKGDISPEAMIAKATNGLEHWTQNSEQMERWQSIGMSDREFADILKETICHKKTRAADVEAKLAINERRLNWLLERFNEEKAELGSTMWGAYNALTHYATHLPMSRESNTNREMVATRRNNEVRTVIDSPSWRYLEEVAARKTWGASSFTDAFVIIRSLPCQFGKGKENDEHSEPIAFNTGRHFEDAIRADERKRIAAKFTAAEPVGQETLYPITGLHGEPLHEVAPQPVTVSTKKMPPSLAKVLRVLRARSYGVTAATLARECDTAKGAILKRLSDLRQRGYVIEKGRTTRFRIVNYRLAANQ